MKITIVGLGLIGGSIAIDLRKRNFASKIIGVDADKLHANIAKEIGLIDDFMELQKGIAFADLVILATPVNATLSLLLKVLNLSENQVITDVCSTKEKLVKSVKNHPKRGNFVAAHPMSGTENSGPWAAKSNLFDSKAVVICNKNESNPNALALIEKMYACLNMRIIYMNAQEHDIHAAYISHISHISAYALASTVLEKEKSEKNIFDMASGGFSSTVRLAKSSPDMWTPIFNQNAENILVVLETYINKLIAYKEAIQKGDSLKITQLINSANKIRKIIG